MKTLPLLLSILFAAGTAFAADSAAPATGTTDKTAPVAAAPPASNAAANPASDTAKPVMKSHHFTTEVVSTDVDKKEITIKSSKGESHTATVEGKALATLKSLTAGEKVAITYRDDDKGALQAVTAIKPVKAKSAKSAKSTDTQTK